MGIFSKKAERAYLGYTVDDVHRGIQALDDLRCDVYLSEKESDACIMAILFMEEIAARMEDGKKIKFD